MRNFDAQLTAEMLKEAYIFFFLAEFQFDTPVYYTTSDIPVVYGGHRYEPKNFTVGDVNYAAMLSVDNVRIRIDNVGLDFSAMLLSQDVRNREAAVHYGCFIGPPSGNIKVVEVFRGILGEWELDEGAADITIVNEFVLWKKKTLRTAQATCPWPFRGAECGYSGGLSWCDQSYERCQALANTNSFGGFRWLPATAEKEIWWGKIPK